MSQTKAQLLDGSVVSVAFSAGSAAEPSLYFAGDTNTGIYSPGADQVAISTGGTGRLFVSSAGLVGIGNSAPEEKLDIQGAGRTTLRIFNSTPGSAASPQLTTIDFNGYALIPKGRIEAQDQASDYGGGWLAFSTANSAGTLTKALTIDNAQRVGIGTTSPDVNFVVSNGGTSSSASGGTLARVVGSGVSRLDIVGGNSNYSILEFSRANLTAAGQIAYEHSSNSIYFSVNGAQEAVRIDSSKRLLVGTSSNASNALAVIQGYVGLVSGQGVLALRLGTTRPAGANTDIGSIRFESTSNTSSNYHYASISAFSDGTSSSDTDIPGRLVFSTTADGAASPTERMRITSAGNVGINVTPVTKLDLSGNYSQNITAVSALDLDLSTSNFFTKTINANSTFTVSNTPAGRAFSFTLELTHTSGTITWFSGVEWPGGTAPTLSTGKTHLFMFVTDDGGTRWRGASLINYTT